MKKKLILTATIIAWLSLTGWSFAFNTWEHWIQYPPQPPQVQMWIQQKIHNRYEMLKEQAKERYERMHNYIKQKTSNIDVKKIKEGFAERIQKFKESLPSNTQELKQKYYELKSKLANATADERREIATKLSMIRQKYYGIANRPHTQSQYWPSTWVVKPQPIQQNQQSNIVLPQQLKQKIDQILNYKLFKRIEKLSNEKQITILNKVHTKVVFIINKTRSQLNQRYSKWLAYKESILNYLDQKVNGRLTKLKENSQPNVDKILSEALWN